MKNPPATFEVNGHYNPVEVGRSWMFHWLAWRPTVMQWGGVIALGLLLGSFAVFVTSLRNPQWTFLLTLAALLPFVVLIVGRLRRVLLAIIVLDIPFALDINIGFREELSGAGAVGGLSISLTLGALIALYAWWLVEALSHKRDVPQPTLSLSLPAAAYLLFAGISIVNAEDVTLSFYELFLLLKMFFLYLYIASVVRSRDEVIFILTVMLVGLALESLIIIGLRVTGESIDLGPIQAVIAPDGRASGTFARANTAGSYLSQLVPIALALFLANVKGWRRGLAAFSLVFGSLALIITLSRGGWTGLLLAVAIVLLGAWKRGWLSLRVLIAVGLLTLPVLLSGDEIANRLLVDDKGAAEVRVPLAQLALNMIEDHPLLGVGANNFAVNISEYATPEFGGVWLSTVHNNYLLIWAEKGIFGLAAYIWFLLAALWRGLRAYGRGDRLLALVALGLTASIAGHMTQMFVDFFNQRVLVQSLWLNAGLAAAAYEIVKVNSRTESEKR